MGLLEINRNEGKFHYFIKSYKEISDNIYKAIGILNEVVKNDTLEENVLFDKIKSFTEDDLGSISDYYNI